MTLKNTSRVMTIVVTLAILSSLFAPSGAAALPSADVSFVILHTNDFHGQLEEVLASPGTSSNPGMARVAQVVKNVRAVVGADNVLLVDAGDEMQGSLLSNVQQGVPTIAAFNAMGYVAATFGNHEFDWGQAILQDRTDDAEYPYVTANIVVNDTGNCLTAGWTTPDFADQPYVIKTVGTEPNDVQVAFIGVTTTETPIITLAESTAGLCFKDPADSIIHYYDEMKAQADVIVVLSHLGYVDGGYGYGIPIYGDQTLAKKLNTALKPVNLIIGGHSHTNLSSATVVGTTVVAQAHYNGRKVGRANITVKPSGAVNISWERLTVYASNNPPATPEDSAIKTLIATYASDPAYQALISQEVGWTNVPIARNYDGDSLMGYFVNDAVYNDLNTDAVTTNDVDMVFNNPGGLRADISCAAYPCLLTYGMTFSVLPFGNQTIVGDMTGAQIMELLNQAASLSKGAIQPAGMRYKFYNYRNWSSPTAFRTWAWGAFDACVIDKTTGECEPLDLTKTYRVATNEFLAPAGQDNFTAFKYMTNITYWGDMLDNVNRWVTANYTAVTPYNEVLDGRITRDGNDTTGSIIPITILHHNDMHGNLYKGTYVGYTQLATLIKQERAYNPTRTLLLNSGDDIQGDGFTFYFKTAPFGYAVDGTPLTGSLTTNPVMAVMNIMGYDAMTLGNHEFNFGKDIFTGVLSQAEFPILQANLEDDGQYGIASLPVLPYVEKEVEGIKIAILGIGNHRVPNYELPSNIPGLSFSDPLETAQDYSDQLNLTNDVVIALTHIGFTENPTSVEIDENVDTNMAMTVTGLDAIIGGHSHTNPATGFGNYKYLPTLVGDPDNIPVIINHAYRYNNTLGEIIIGVRANAEGGYDVVTRAGQYISVATATEEDPALKAMLQPYINLFNSYNNTVVGQTTQPINTTNAYIAETNAANLQADAAIFELSRNGITDVDFHLSGAMTRPSSSSNWILFPSATAASPVNMKISDMFTLMPYENSLVVMDMNGPQLKAVLERGYRNYYYYKYVPGYGGYSYYTTCMLDINSVGKITYNDLYPAAYDPAKQYVVSLEVDGQEVDFTDASTYYRVSTVNYLAAGSCNFNDGGATLWPLDQLVADTQFYVRDAVINYADDVGIISPVIEGRLNFITDTTPPVITVDVPLASTYLNSDSITLSFSAADDIAGVKSTLATLDGEHVENGQVIELYTYLPGEHTFIVTAMDKAYNQSSTTVTFSVSASVESMTTVLTALYNDGAIDSADVYQGLMDKLLVAGKAKNEKTRANQLEAFINQVNAQSGKHITEDAANLLISDVQWLLTHP